MGVYSTQMLHGAGIYTYIYPKKWPKRRWRFHTWSTWDICFLPKSNCWPLERTSEAAKNGAKLNRMGSSGGYSAMCLHMFWRYLEGHTIQPPISDVSTQKKAIIQCPPTVSNDPGSRLERVGRQCSAGQTRSSHPVVASGQHVQLLTWEVWKHVLNMWGTSLQNASYVYIYIFWKPTETTACSRSHVPNPCASAAKGKGSRWACGGRDLCLERHLEKGATLLWPGGTIWFVGSGIQLHHFHLLIRDHSFGVGRDQAISGWAATNLSRLVAEPGSKGAARDQSKVLTLGTTTAGRDERSFWRWNYRDSSQRTSQFGAKFWPCNG